ncbi:MAG: Transglutaminase-like enzyme putative cysteine protease [Devosia sp.]|uniref:transglutaminase domain-containing protein n=1 Tax=Devosia sp. TaxID=1871048 RepID=UPI002633EB73|nr:transglutaminase domain-containing protein [Devosia sp.]MDB5527930.1 Transglutaminase-like enzyme putative cysteine protease [Devosia sp.]
MRISIRHQLSTTPLPGSPNAVLHLLLTPQSGPTQTVESWSVEMAGIGNAGRFTDAYGNSVHLVNQRPPEGELVVTVEGVVTTVDRHGVFGRVGPGPVPALFKRVTPLTKAPVSLYGRFRGSKDSRIDVLHALMARVGEVLHSPTAVIQNQSQTQSGQSQSQSQGGPTAAEGEEAPPDLPRPPATDYAHAFIGAARALDIPARYITGYLVGDEDDPAAFHAWAEAYDEALGWVGFDAMLGLCPTDRHVRLAVGLDGLSAQPLRAVPAGDGPKEIGVSVEVVS